MKDLAHADGPVAVVLEVLRDGLDVVGGVPEVGDEVVDSGSVRPPPGQQGGSAGGAPRDGDVSSFEEQALGGQAVQAGCVHAGMDGGREVGARVGSKFRSHVINSYGEGKVYFSDSSNSQSGRYRIYNMICSRASS